MQPTPPDPLRAVRPLLRALRHGPDRFLHARRRRDALRLVAALRDPGPVVFVCLGNVCRSPFAAGAFRNALPEALRGAVRVESAGLIGPGRPCPADGIAVAAARGVELEAHRSETLTAKQARGAGLLVVMGTDQRERVGARFRVPDAKIVLLGDLDPLPIDTRTVFDPWRRGEEAFGASYDRIERCVAELARAALPWLTATAATVEAR